jgi:hypothetical protein
MTNKSNIFSDRKNEHNKEVLTLKSFESLEKVANGQATKIIIPSEIQGLAGLSKALSETMKQ